MGGQFANRLFCFQLRAKERDSYVCPTFGEGERDGTTDSLGRSGDEHGLSL
jgi:hypothetical protein